MKRYRVHAYTIMRPDYGYVGLYPHRYQDLQVRRWWGWQTMEREEVPPYVACYAPVGGADWRSAFGDRFTWGRDGIATPRHGA